MSDDKYLLDTNTDCGLPAAVVIGIWLFGLSCIVATLIAVAVVMTLAGR